MIHVTATESDAVRAIEAEAVSSRFDRGWHCLGLAETFKDGKPHTIDPGRVFFELVPDREGSVQLR